MVALCNYTIIPFDLLFSHVDCEVEDSKGGFFVFTTSSTLYTLYGGICATYGGAAVGSVAISLSSVSHE